MGESEPREREKGGLLSEDLSEDKGEDKAVPREPKGKYFQRRRGQTAETVATEVSLPGAL